ncbi:MAG: hypothetical protein ABI972_21930 [Acidobacteriota bacterium]
MRHDPHVSDEELVAAIEGELAAERAATVQAHLVHCWKCRVRRSEMEAAIAGVVQLQRSSYDGRIPPADGPAARLRAQMEQLGARPATMERLRAGWYRAAKPALAGAAVVSLAVLGIWFSGQSVSAAGPLPDARLTPGATRVISREQVCALPAQEEGRAISPELARRVFQQYRIENPEPRTYEVDYLISPSLGGADDIRNLWPQPYNEGVWTSRVKDALEDHLRQKVCEGRMDLAAAQWEIANNWIAAYRKYFHTNYPIAAHALFVKDRPWE